MAHLLNRALNMINIEKIIVHKASDEFITDVEFPLCSLILFAKFQHAVLMRFGRNGHSRTWLVGNNK